MSDKPLCPWCTARHDRALSHDLHATPEARQRLRTDLAKVCGPHCPKPERPAQEAPR